MRPAAPPPHRGGRRADDWTALGPLDPLNPLNPLAAALALVAAWLTAWVLVRRSGPPAQAGRFVTIDGLRGYLAFMVYLHHAAERLRYAVSV